MREEGVCLMNFWVRVLELIIVCCNIIYIYILKEGDDELGG